MSNWKHFIKEIIERIKNPFNYPQYVGYFIFCILLVGAAGVHIKIFDLFTSCGDNSQIWSEVGTYSIAILGASVLDLNLSEKLRNKDSILVWSLIVLTIGFVLLILIREVNSMSWLFGSLGILISWFMWWFAHSDNPALTKDVNVTSSSTTGGSTDTNLTGNTDDYDA